MEKLKECPNHKAFKLPRPDSNEVKVLVTQLCLTLVTPWTVALQAPLSMRFSGQECWSGLLFPSPGDLPDPGSEHVSPALQADSLPLSHLGSPVEATNQSFLLKSFPHLSYSQSIQKRAQSDIPSSPRNTSPPPSQLGCYLITVVSEFYD